MYDIEEELILWFKVAVDRSLQRMKRKTFKAGNFARPMSKELAGIGVRYEHVTKALAQSGLENKQPREWKDNDSRKFSEALRMISKPTVIVANKMDLAYSEKNFEKLREEFKSQLVIPVSSEAEVALNRAEKQ